MNWTEVLSLAATLLGTLSSAGPWGIGAMVLGGGVMAFLANGMIKKFNASVDAKDDATAGADAGKTAQDLKKQADDNRTWLEQQRKQWEDENKEEEER